MAEKYHAVSIAFGKNACELATKLAGKRFLSAEAPLLPLCVSTSCQCRYHHYKDRRADDRRDVYKGISATSWAHPERRKRISDRRA